MKLEKAISTAILVTLVVFATAPVGAQRPNGLGAGGRAGIARGTAGELSVPQRATYPGQGSGRRVPGLPLVVRPCEPGPRYGPQLPHGICLSIYPDAPRAREKATMRDSGALTPGSSTPAQ